MYTQDKEERSALLRHWAVCLLIFWALLLTYLMVFKPKPYLDPVWQERVSDELEFRRTHTDNSSAMETTSGASAVAFQAITPRGCCGSGGNSNHAWRVITQTNKIIVLMDDNGNTRTIHWKPNDVWLAVGGGGGSAVAGGGGGGGRGSNPDLTPEPKPKTLTYYTGYSKPYRASKDLEIKP